MTDDELRKRTSKLLMRSPAHDADDPLELNGNTAIALLEKCVAEREGLQPIVISIFPSSAVINVSNVISFQTLTTRNIIEACVLALEGKDD